MFDNVPFDGEQKRLSIPSIRKKVQRSGFKSKARTFEQITPNLLDELIEKSNRLGGQTA